MLIRSMRAVVVCAGLLAICAGAYAQPQVVHVTQSAPLFLTPNARQPLTQASPTLALTVIKVEGVWVNVSWEDARFGHRSGYVELKYTTLAPPRPTPAAPRASAPATGSAPARRPPQSMPVSDAQSASAPAAVPGRVNSAELTPTALFAKNRAAIVTIKTPTGFGSGVIIGATGLVITNLHVIKDDTSAVVTLADGDTYDTVTVAAVDARRDLSLLRIAGYGLPTVEIGDSDRVRVGNRAYTIGAPEGLELSLSDGLISAVRDSGDGFKVLQTTAAISHGSSGGGLFDDRGALIGITSFKFVDGESLNFAIPVNYVRGLTATIGDAPMTLTEVHAKYGDSQRAARTNRASSPSAPSTPSGLPDLRVSYKTTVGATMLVQQRGDAATITLYTTNAQIFGHAVVTWNPATKAFSGQAEINYVCGQIDTRVQPVTSQIEFRVESGGTLRQRYSHATRLNCSKGEVGGWQWVEQTWWPGPV